MALDLWLLGFAQNVGDVVLSHPDPDEPPWLFACAWEVYCIQNDFPASDEMGERDA